MLGVGPGALISDSLMLGLDPVRNRAKMDEALGVIVRLLAGEVVTHHADWFTLQDAQLQLLPVNGSHADRRRVDDVAGRDGVRRHPRRRRPVARRRPHRRPEGPGRRSGRWARRLPPSTARCSGARSGAWSSGPTSPRPREEAIAEVREGRERERSDYFRRVAGLKNDCTLEQEIEEDTALVGTPDDVVAALRRLQDATGGFGGFMVLGHDWAGREATLRSYELMGRHVIPEFTGHLDAAAAQLRHRRGEQALLRRARARVDPQGLRRRRGRGARRPQRHQPPLSGTDADARAVTWLAGIGGRHDQRG